MAARNPPGRVGRAGLAAVVVAVVLAGCGLGWVVLTDDGSGNVGAGPASTNSLTTTSDAADAGGHEHGASVAPVDLPPATQAALDAQLAVARTAAKQYRTVQDALDDGFVLLGREQDRNDTHLVRWDRMDHVFDPAAPEQLLAESRDPGDRIIALVYYETTASKAPPEGFPGANDHWHEHRGVCRVGDVAVSEGDATSKAACERQGGQFGTADGWMLHVWAVRGWSNREGVFLPENRASPPG